MVKKYVNGEGDIQVCRSLAMIYLDKEEYKKSTSLMENLCRIKNDGFSCEQAKNLKEIEEEK